MLAKDVRALLEAYGTIYSNNGPQQELIDEEVNNIIEEVVEELIEECVDLGYTLDEAAESIEEATIKYLTELNPYAPAGSKESSAYNKATTATKRGEARKAAVKAAVGKVRQKATNAAVSAYAAGKMVSTAASDAKNTIKSGIKKALGGGLRAVANKAGKVASRLGEETNIFDTVLEFLQAEGYAETLEEAEWMMANVIDEEAIDIILGEGHGSRRSFKTQSADERKRVNMFKGSKIEYTPHKNYDPEANRGQGQILRPNQAEKQRRKGLAKAAMGEEYMDEAQDATPPKGQSKYGRKAPAGYMQTRKPTLQQMSSREKQAWRGRGIGEEYMDEAEHARNNPDKYEEGEKKKYAHVRGEKTPMPPRGDKRREDFEKWYAANVR